MFTHLTFDPSAVTIFIKLGSAMLCGVIIGAERNISHKAAGMRTYALVAMGAALFMVMNDLLINQYVTAGVGLTDPLQMPSMIISGIGFMGAGLIILQNKNVTGITTASGLWIAAGIGMAAGAGFYVPAFMATLLVLFIFEVLWHLEQRVKRISAFDEPIEPDKP